MSEVASLWASLGLDTAKFNEGIAKASASMTAFEKSVKPIARGFKNFGKDLDKLGSSLTSNLTTPILAAGAAITATLYATSKFGGEINDMSVRTGFSREALQELKFAADQTGVSMESIEGATRKLTKSMGEAATGEGKAAGLFKQLGIEVANADGSLRPANEVFNETLEALKRIPDETTRNVVGMQLLGKSAGDLNPLIAAGKDGLNAFAKEARDAGLVMSEDAVIAADEFGDKMDKLKAQFGHAAMEIGTAFMPLILELAGFLQANVIPAIKKLAEWFTGLSDSQKKWIAGIAFALAAIGPLITAFGAVSTAIGWLISISPVIGAAWAVITGPIGLVVIAIGAVIAAIGYLINKAADAAGGFGNLWNYIKGVFDNLIRYAKSVGKVIEGVFTLDMDTINAGINDFNNALEIGSRNTLEHQKNVSILVNKYNSQAEASKAAEASTRAHIEEMRKGKPVVDALSVSLEAATKKQKEHKGAFVETKESILGAQIATDEYGRSLQELTLNSVDTTMKLSSLGSGFEDVAFKGNAAFTSLTTKMQESKQVFIDVGAIIQSSIMEAVDGVSQAITSMATTTGHVFETLGKVLLNSLAGFLTSFGKAMIAASTAAMLVNSPALATPAGVAAGIGLVALGSVMKGLLQKPIAFADGGLVFGETMSLIGEGRGTTRSNPEVVAPLDKLMGFMPQGGEGMGGKVEFIIQGETLRAVLDKNNKSNRFLGNKG